jgi:pimeloyl-ACP methyl ester carboxylesterase
MWNEFDALAHVPMLLIHGVNSDILSADTVTAMQAHHPGMAVIDVPDEGHVPLLDNDELIGRIARFVETCDPASRSTAAYAKTQDAGEQLLSTLKQR